MSLKIKILFLIVGTLLVVLGIIGIYGAIEIYNESSDINSITSQTIVPISLIIIGVFLLFQFYNKPKKEEKVK